MQVEQAVNCIISVCLVMRDCFGFSRPNSKHRHLKQLRPYSYEGSLGQRDTNFNMLKDIVASHIVQC